MQPISGDIKIPPDDVRIPCHSRQERTIHWYWKSSSKKSQSENKQSHVLAVTEWKS